MTYGFGHQIDMNRKGAKVAKNYYSWRSWRLERSGRWKLL